MKSSRIHRVLDFGPVAKASPSVPPQAPGELSARQYSASASTTIKPPPVPALVRGRVPVLPPDGERLAKRSFRRWWASTCVSLVIHMFVLVILALIMTASQVSPSRRPIVIANGSDEGELPSLVEMEIEALIEMPPPVPSASAQDAVEPAVALIDEEVASMMGPSFVLDTQTPSLTPSDLDNVLSPVDTASVSREISARPSGGRIQQGGADGDGEALGGFGGDVGRRLANAGAQTGDVQVSLTWDYFNDLDLHVVAPSGEHIFFGHRWSACRGLLDVDMNAHGPATREPVENVFWPVQAAPWGEYQVFVHHFARWDQADETAFQVHVLVNGKRQTFAGSVRAGQPAAPVARFMKNGFAGRGPPAFGE